jgi:hypothetical protein
MTRARILRTLVLALAAALILSVPLSSGDPFMGFRVVNPPFTPLTYGIQAFTWWDHGFAGRDLDWVRTMVFSHVKQTFAWEDVEPFHGQWDFTQSDRIVGEIERRGLKLVARLSDAPDWSHPSVQGARGVDFVDAPPDNLADFGAYCGAIAGRYRGRIAAYQIWNEPNLSREWGSRPPDAAGFVALLAVCSAAIRAADPDAILISGGLSPTGNYDASAHPDDMYLQAMYDGGFAHHIDVVGMHAPGFSEPHVSPEDAERDGSQRFFTFRRVEDLRRVMIANGDAGRQAAILETGYTTDQLDPAYSWFAVTEAEQAARLVAAYEYAAFHWRPWVGLMSAIYIANPDWQEDDEEFWWAITRPNGYTAPAYIELANMAKYCGDRLIPARAPDSPEALGLVPVIPCA